MACKVDENIAPDGSFSGWPASSQWACADAAKGVLLSPVSRYCTCGETGLFLST